MFVLKFEKLLFYFNRMCPKTLDSCFNNPPQTKIGPSFSGLPGRSALHEAVKLLKMLPGMSTKEDQSKVKSGNTENSTSCGKRFAAIRLTGWIFPWLTKRMDQDVFFCWSTLILGLRHWDKSGENWKEWVCFYWILPNHLWDLCWEIYCCFLSPGRIANAQLGPFWKTGKSPNLGGKCCDVFCNELWWSVAIWWQYIYSIIM